MKRSVFIRSFILLFNSSPGRVIAALFLMLVLGVLPSVRIFISMKLITIIAGLLQSTEAADLTAIFNLLFVWAAVTLVSELAVHLQSALHAVITEKFSASIMSYMADRLASLHNIGFFENRENLIKVDMVREQIQVRPQNYVYNLLSNLQRIINLISMFTVLFTVDYLLPILMICSTIPVFIISQKAGKKQWSKTEKLQDEKLKLTTYIKHCLEGEKVKDNFLFGFVENFKTTYDKTKDAYVTAFIRIARKGVFFQLITGVISAAIGIALFCIMIFIVIKKRIAVGAVAGYVQAFMYTQYEIQDLATYGRWYFILMGYFKNFFDIIDWSGGEKESGLVSCTDAKAKLHIILDEKIESIELKNVWFSYTGNENEFVVKDVSLFIDAKKMYAVVGKNGSGKTTLVKLLMGFYTPQKGSIIINGKYDLTSLDAKTYRNRLSAVFQDFAIYAGYTVDENVFVKPEWSAEEDREKSTKVQFLGAEFQKRFENKYGSIIGMQYGGEEFSGGQKQRLASLRSFVKKSEVMFFDEPTSAIDPIAENEFISQIFSQTADKIALIVTHRMRSVKSCDEIIVIDSGQVKEKGAFSALMERQGLFAELYNSQVSDFEK